LNIPYLSNCSSLQNPAIYSDEGRAEVEVESEQSVLQFSVSLPAVFGFQYTPKRKLPYIRFEDLNRDVSSQLEIIGNDSLGFSPTEVGLKGSLTMVKRLDTDRLYQKNTITVSADEQGIETVYQFLQQKGIVP
jgi:electron transfer flavoprotein beta subunit